MHDNTLVEFEPFLANARRLKAELAALPDRAWRLGTLARQHELVGDPTTAATLNREARRLWLRQGDLRAELNQLYREFNDRFAS